MLKADTLRELQKAATFMPARQFVKEHEEELAQLPKAQPYVNGILTGASNDQIRAAYTALAVVVRMDLDDLLKSAKPVTVPSKPAPVHNVRVKVIPAQPGDRQFDQEDRRNFRLAIGLIKEVEAKIKEADAKAPKSKGKARKEAEKAARQEAKQARPALKQGSGKLEHTYVPSSAIEVKPVYMGEVQTSLAITCFFADVVRMNGGALGAWPKDDKVDTTKLDQLRRMHLVVPSAVKTKNGVGIDARDIIEKHSQLLSSHPATTRYMLQYRRAQINAVNMIEAARRAFSSKMGKPLADKVDVRGWTRRPIPGCVTPEKLEAYEAAKRYVVNMAALGLTIQDPIFYELRDILRVEAGPRVRGGKQGARSGKGRSLAAMLQEAVFGKGLAGDAQDIEQLLNGAGTEE